MWSDLQSVGNGAISTFARAFENVRNCCSSPQDDLDFLQDLSRAVSRFSRCLIVIVFDPVGSEKCRRWLPVTRHLEKRETGLDRSWRKVQVVSEARNSSFAHFRGKSSSEHADSTISNWLQIRLHKKWPEINSNNCCGFLFPVVLFRLTSPPAGHHFVFLAFFGLKKEPGFLDFRQNLKKNVFGSFRLKNV